MKIFRIPRHEHSLAGLCSRPNKRIRHADVMSAAQLHFRLCHGQVKRYNLKVCFQKVAQIRMTKAICRGSTPRRKRISQQLLACDRQVFRVWLFVVEAASCLLSIIEGAYLLFLKNSAKFLE